MLCVGWLEVASRAEELPCRMECGKNEGAEEWRGGHEGPELVLRIDGGGRRRVGIGGQMPNLHETRGQQQAF
jgi:hypothetical protein